MLKLFVYEQKTHKWMAGLILNYLWMTLCCVVFTACSTTKNLPDGETLYAGIDKLEVLNAYLIKNFRLAFGNRIMKQIRDYVPCFIACGGTEIQAIDFIVAKKVLRKFESLSLGFMREELNKFSTYLDKLFGKNTMVICKAYIEQLKKNN